MPIKIFIDQGHNPAGSPNAGAISGDVYEGDINYNVGVYLKEILDRDSRFEARLSRPTADTVLGTDNSSSLSARVEMANRWPADYFISIHSNLSLNPAINGTEMYIYRYGSQANWLAESILNGIVAAVGTKRNGIFTRPSLYVLRATHMPAVLIELGYISNPGDADKLMNNQPQFAYGIYQGLLDYFGLQPLQSQPSAVG
ncbi:MAG: N-acetylmuramoyl-L-alanine amidase family protein [Eubacteriales bacterium]|jgi:N-acetylmuramoyl-L-alanine amidase